ncbi:hypothetical protein Ndes2437B_g00493 [Nannochloris sp. 'desiccata']
MLAAGTLVSVELPDREGEIIARVVKCSTQGRSCTLQVEETEELITGVNIAKCNYSIIEESESDDDPQADGENTDSEAGSEEEDGEEEEELEELDVFRDFNIDSDAFDQLITTDPSNLLQRSGDMATAARTAAKQLLDYAAKQAPVHDADGTTAALYVDGFDAEQIWLQLDMLSAPALKRARKQLKKTEAISTLMPADVEEALDELLGGGGELLEERENDSGSEDDEEEEEEEEFNSEDDDKKGMDYDALLEAGRKEKKARKDSGASVVESEDEGSEEDEESGEESEDDRSKSKRGKKQNTRNKYNNRLTNDEAIAAVEDDFMKLDEMEAFLQQAEREYAGEGTMNEEEEEKNGTLIENSDSEGDIDDEALGRDQHSSEDDASEDEDLQDGGYSGSDVEEAELEALLDNAAGLIGKKRKKGKKNKKKFAGGLSDSEEEEEEEEEEAELEEGAVDVMYEDFFGPRKLPRGGSGDKKKGAVEPGRKNKQQQRQQKKHRDVLAEDPTTSSEEDKQEDEGYSEEDEEDDLDDDLNEKPSSTHQRRLERTAMKIKKMEKEAMTEKPWWMQGEVIAGSRPKNSALEIDLDYETTVKPPPPPTEESTRSLEDLIKDRIGDGRFDDPIKFVPPPPEKTKTTVQLDDKKSAAGLGELYEQDYVRAVTGVVVDRDAPVRELATAQFKALSAALDALSHGHYRPVPNIEEVTVKVDVPAILMEEAAPAFVSTASMRAPEEVYKAGTGAITLAEDTTKDRNNQYVGEESDDEDTHGKNPHHAGLRVVLQPGGGFKSEAELTKEDRKRRRADKKRASKKRKVAAEENAAARAATMGTTRISNRKSEEEQQELRKLAKATKNSRAGGVSNYSRSAKVFAQLQAERDGAGVEGAAAAVANAGKSIRASGFKL